MPDACIDEKLRSIRLLAMDVDGVLTDGTIGWAAAASGELIELKGFNVKDGLGLSLARAAGMETAWITGRISLMVERRAAELRISHLCQWARNKRVALGALCAELELSPEQVLYIGDDLNDLPAFDVAGVRVAVADATDLVRERADWITAAPGGRGAVREVVERVLRAQSRWDDAVAAFLARLEQEQDHPPGAAPAAQ